MSGSLDEALRNYDHSMPYGLKRFRSVNIQDDKGKAKTYQVRQVLLAIDRLKGMEAKKESATNDEH